ncbi:MAG: hypothetical protein JWQ43_3053 [Glaciihabitans sp.]|nr:hypothetical protein [Glaciihabitans sp.]
MIAAEFRRLTATRLGVIALIALTCVPVIYGGLYLWANQDPYNRLDQIPVALVVSDTGATVDDSFHNYGDEISDEVLDDGTFDWHLVSAAEAETGVDDATYDFSVTLPADFSTALASASSDDPEQAEVILTTNDANSYLATTIGEQAVKTLRTSIVEKVNKEAADQFLLGISTIRGKISDAASGATTLLDGATTASSGANSLATGTATLSTGAASLASGAATLATGAQSAADGATALSTGAASAATGAQDLATGAATLSTGAASAATGAQDVANGASSLATGAATLQTGAHDLSTGAKTLTGGADQVAAGNAQLAAQADQIGALASAGVADLPQARTDITALLTQAGLSEATINSVLSELDPVDTALGDANAQIQAVVGQVDQLAAGSAAVATGADSLASGAASLATGSDTLAAGTSTLATGSSSLATGTATLATGAASLASGAGTLASGSSTLASGAASLASGTGTLASGSSTLADGSNTLATGASDAATGAASLADGLGELTTGVGTLRDGLNNGVSSIPESTDASRAVESDAIADPVAVTNNAVTAAGTYGAGLAPFFASLASWIGIYALFLIVKPVSKRAITALRSPVKVTLAGWLTPGILGAIQMAGLFAILAFALKFTISNPVGLFGVMVLASLTFAAIILALNVWLGSVGQFIGLVLMVIQLVTAGGTFPWQTLPAPLAFLHHVLPMSAAVDAMRQIMYGGDLSAAGGDMMTLLYWLVGGLLFAAIGVTRMTHTRTLRDLQPSLIG